MEYPVWSLIGGVVGFLASIVVSIVGYFLRQTLEGFKVERAEMEHRLNRRLIEMTNNLDEVEKVSLQLKSSMYKELNGLSEKFVPRPEIKEALQSIRDTNTSTAQAVGKLSDKLDKLFVLIAKGIGHVPGD